MLQRFEKIVQELGKGEAPLGNSLTLFEEGIQFPQPAGNNRRKRKEK
jgi:exonuclease VII small subunit